MKKTSVITAFIISLIFAVPAFSETIISFSGGSFSPEEDFMSAFDTGYTLAAGCVTSAGDMFALGIEAAFSQTEAEAGIHGNSYKDTLSTFGIEAVFYIQPKDARIQPYAGIGIGVYGNNVTSEINDTEYFDDSGSAFGGVAKAGLRLYLDDKFFIGGYAKYFTNEQDFQLTDGSIKSLNIGGTSLMFEVGAKLK
ncbi:MAG: outer membrane protein [Desulfobacteraceae bacterium]|jgi:hypothetical protein